MSKDGRILNLNDTLLRWLDFKREEVLEVKFFQDFLSIGGKIYFETHLMPLLQMQGEFSEIKTNIKGKGSKIIPALIYGKRVKRTIDEQVIFRVSILDITQRHLFEMELVKAQKQAELTNLRLREINEELEHFAYNASHDLQAPLNTITSLISLIENKYMSGGDRGKELLALIINNTHRMKMMISDLLDYSKIDTISSKYQPVSLNEACRQALEMLDVEVKKHRAEIIVEELPVVSGVQIQLVRLFQNLFSNALKYRSDAKPLITISWEKSSDFHTISIRDNGIGFDQKYASRIFLFMERLHSHDAIAGTGIGLSACKRIVEKHGGLIHAVSEHGKGSCFYFTFPIDKNAVV